MMYIRQSLLCLIDAVDVYIYIIYPSKIKWDLSNGPLSKLLELLDTQV